MTVVMLPNTTHGSKVTVSFGGFNSGDPYQSHKSATPYALTVVQVSTCQLAVQYNFHSSTSICCLGNKLHVSGVVVSGELGWKGNNQQVH